MAKPAPVNVQSTIFDDFFDDNAPTLYLTENVPYLGKWVELKRGPEVEVQPGDMRPSFLAVLETVEPYASAHPLTREVTTFAVGEQVTYWLFSTVIKDEVKAHKPEAGERIGLIDRGLTLKRAARKAGIKLEDKVTGTFYHNISAAWPDRPDAPPEPVSFDEL